MKKIAIHTLIVTFLLILFCGVSSHAEISSQSYIVPAYVINGGGLQSFSDNFCHVASFGEPTPTGLSQSEHFKNHAGFIPQIASQEICDGIDNDGDGLTDEGFDNDGDGYTTCEGDCDDTDDTIYPGAIEVICDGIDSDCDPNTDNCNTPPGTNVNIQNNTGEVQVSFPVVTGQGNTTITVEDCRVQPEIVILDPDYLVCVDIDTNATFEGKAKICISYEDTGLTSAQENNLTMVRCDELKEICELLPCDPPVPVDTVHNVVCGCTDSFSTLKRVWLRKD